MASLSMEIIASYLIKSSCVISLRNAIIDTSNEFRFFPRHSGPQSKARRDPEKLRSARLKSHRQWDAAKINGDNKGLEQ
jgi:hypothetical protein